VSATTPTSKARPESATTAKLFKNGRSQAVRLPKEFRFEGTEVTIRRNPETGEVVLSPSSALPARTMQEWFDRFDTHEISEEVFERKVDELGKLSAKELFQIFDWAKFPEDFLTDREVHMPRELDLF